MIIRRITPMFLILVIIQFFPHSLEGIERRRPQFQNEFGYVVTPLPFILPGVGTGIGLLGGMNNIVETPVDLYLVFVRGDVEGSILAVTDIHLIPEMLLFDISTVEFNKGQQNRYLIRGMGGEKDDFNIVELSDSNLKGGRLILTFFDRMLEFYSVFYDINFKASAIRDNEGNLVSEFEDPDTTNFQTTTYGTLIDYTDDRTDPKKGLRLQVERSKSPAASEDNVNYYTTDVILTAYIPVFKYSTIAFNYFQSDATVLKMGETDPEKLKTSFGCFQPTVSQCETSVQEVIQDQVNQNTYGSSASLGGRSRLRSYLGGRFSAAHTEFLGAELRWNLTDENTPFDIWIMKDLRTGVQAAFFYETGTVADQRKDLWKEKRDSMGVGARLVTGSGFIYRFDLAYGDEGAATTLFIDYPWGAL